MFARTGILRNKWAKRLSVFDSSARWVGVSRCEIESSNICLLRKEKKNDQKDFASLQKNYKYVNNFYTFDGVP